MWTVLELFTLFLIVVGALNWGLVGAFKLDLVRWISKRTFKGDLLGRRIGRRGERKHMDCLSKVRKFRGRKCGLERKCQATASHACILQGSD